MQTSSPIRAAADLLIGSITADEINFISRLDYGCDSEKHAEALRTVLFNQGGMIDAEQ